VQSNLLPMQLLAFSGANMISCMSKHHTYKSMTCQLLAYHHKITLQLHQLGFSPCRFFFSVGEHFFCL
jgi:hypothetical protein